MTSPLKGKKLPPETVKKMVEGRRRANAAKRAALEAAERAVDTSTFIDGDSLPRMPRRKKSKRAKRGPYVKRAAAAPTPTADRRDDLILTICASMVTMLLRLSVLKEVQ